MQHFIVYINPNTELAPILEVLDTLANRFHIRFFATDTQRDLLPQYIQTWDPKDKSVAGIDCVLVFGGDGTILRAKSIAISTGAPILGVNLGYLGFLSETTFKELEASIQTLVQKRYKLISRMLLDCRLMRDNKLIFSGLALNDAVIYKAETPRMITVRTYCNGRFVFSARCDGVIASSPTGSTAYNLSAGGPLLTPQTKAIVVSHLNPHILAIRPMVFPASDKVCIKVSSLFEPACLQIDGENVYHLLEGDQVIVSEAKRQVDFVKLSNRTFFRIMRNKLHLGK